MQLSVGTGTHRCTRTEANALPRDIVPGAAPIPSRKYPLALSRPPVSLRFGQTVIAWWRPSARDDSIQFQKFAYIAVLQIVIAAALRDTLSRRVNDLSTDLPNHGDCARRFRVRFTSF